MKHTPLKLHKLLALCMSLVLLLAMLPAQALAAEQNTPKEEVVYVNLGADGTVEKINVVNIFELAQAGTIVDYGAYNAVRNMTSTAPIQYADGVATIQAEAGKLYYEGTLDALQMPWNVSVRYYLDGKEYTAQEIAGKCGALKIDLDITRNEKDTSNFFDGFALQVVLTLDTAKCSNIVAADATIANVGSNKQLTHTILPGKGADLEITADVVDFSMDGIAINAIPLNLSVEVDDNALLGPVSELVDAIAKLDNGAQDLRAGIAQLRNGVKNGFAEGADALKSGANKLEKGANALKSGGKTLDSGAKELKDGAADLSDGLQELNEGIKQVQTALETLDEQSPLLVDGSDEYLAGITLLKMILNKQAVTNQDLSDLVADSANILAQTKALVDSAKAVQSEVSFSALKTALSQSGINADSLKSENSSAKTTLSNAIAVLNALKAEGVDVQGVPGSLEKVMQVLDTNNAFIDGTGKYLDSVSVSKLVETAQALSSSYANLDSKIAKLANSLGSVTDSMTTLVTAVSTLAEEYGKLDAGIDAYTDAVAQILEGYTKVVAGADTLVEGGKTLAKGASSLHSGTGDMLDGIVELAKGADSLNNGAGKLDKGVTELLDGIAAVYDGSSQLEDGTSTMVDETKDMDTMITGKIDEMLAQITGSDVELGSFVSEENTQVKSVQFVIRTAGVQAAAEVQEAVETAQPLTFWQKLLKLFGL